MKYLPFLLILLGCARIKSLEERVKALEDKPVMLQYNDPVYNIPYPTPVPWIVIDTTKDEHDIGIRITY